VLGWKQCEFWKHAILWLNLTLSLLRQAPGQMTPFLHKPQFFSSMKWGQSPVSLWDSQVKWDET
jgi:hypothetical protein